MKNTFGNNLSLTLFGESHGPAVGAVLDGLAPGIPVDEEKIKEMLALRRPQGQISTARCEQDAFKILSGVFEGRTTGTPLCIVIENADTRSADYGDMRFVARPSHADYTANVKYRGCQDFRGGGHFSGRITAALCAAGGILLPALSRKGVFVGSHIKSIGNICDCDFDDAQKDIKFLENKPFATIDDAKGKEMQELILNVKKEGDSIGGTVETAVCGLPAGVGEPWFDTVEGVISHALFSVPGVKGVEFGRGFAISQMRGSQANDPFCKKADTIGTETNNSGGINGGITNGEPVIFRTAFRPTPTLSIEQRTVDLRDGSETTLAAKGRHDPCIVHRARIVVDCVTALAVADLLATHFGTDWLGE